MNFWRAGDPWHRCPNAGPAATGALQISPRRRVLLWDSLLKQLVHIGVLVAAATHHWWNFYILFANLLFFPVQAIHDANKPFHAELAQVMGCVYGRGMHCVSVTLSMSVSVCVKKLFTLYGVRIFHSTSATVLLNQSWLFIVSFCNFEGLFLEYDSLVTRRM